MRNVRILAGLVLALMLLWWAEACLKMTKHKCWLLTIGLKLLIHDIVMGITYACTTTSGVVLMLVSLFFYWLDIGAGKEIDLTECPRSILQERHLERNQYEYIVSKGKFIHKRSGHDLHTIQGSQAAKWIFVFSTSGRLYVGKKEKGRFHHSSFLAGGATIAAGSLVAEHGILKSISRCSGHYRPRDDSLKRFLTVLGEYGVNLNGVQIEPAQGCACIA